MFIETEGTPNPATLKFLPGRLVLGNATADFASPAAAAKSPLAASLFALSGVARAFLGADFISVTKSDEVTWQVLKPRVLGVITDHFLSGRPVLEGEAGSLDEDETLPEDQEVVAAIKELLETRVRPAVAGDGGDIIFRGYREGVVRLYLQGSCSGCPSSRATLKHGIENMLRHYIPEVTEVEQVDL